MTTKKQSIFRGALTLSATANAHKPLDKLTRTIDNIAKMGVALLPYP